VKSRKRASDTAVTTAPPMKSRLLEKRSTSPKNISLSASSSYNFDDPLVSRVSELEVSKDFVFPVWDKAGEGASKAQVAAWANQSLSVSNMQPLMD